uniref:Single domain-containing protein n=1 Tax=Graphocephala atropunctata TaxID=36148 RepID=A0A1B6LQK8_9HEMI
MLLHVTVVLLISVCVYCDEKTEKSNATVEAKEVASNKTGGDSSNADTKLRMLGNLNPNEHFQKQEMVNQYLSKSDPGNGRMGQQMGGNFPIGGEMQRMPLMHQQSNNMPNPDISINEQLRQNILNSIRGGQQSQNGALVNSGSNPSPFGSSMSQPFSPSNSPSPFGSSIGNSFSPSSNPSPFGSSLSQPFSQSSSPSFSPSSSLSYSSSNRPSLSSDKSFSGFNYGRNEGLFGRSGQQSLCNVSGRVLFHGDKWTSPGVCGLFTCADNNFRTLTTSCPSLSYQEEANCFIEEQDLSRSFPHCCPKLVCSSRERSGETRKYGDFLF